MSQTDFRTYKLELLTYICPQESIISYHPFPSLRHTNLSRYPVYVMRFYLCAKKTHQLSLLSNPLSYRSIKISHLRSKSQTATTMAKPSQAFTITSCTHTDLASCFGIISAAFQHRAPIVDVLFPNHDTLQGTEHGITRLKSWQDSDPNAHFIRVTSSNGNTVGFAVWTFMSEPPPADLAKVEDMDAIWGKLPNGETEKEFAKQLWKWYVIPRSDAVKASEGKGVYGE